MSSSIIFTYKKNLMTNEKKTQLVNYAQNNNFGLHFEQKDVLVQEIIDNLDNSQSYFTLSDAQFHDTADEILSWNWLWTKDRLIKHHLYLDELKNLLMQNQTFDFCIYVSFESYTSLLEYETVTNVNSISQYFADYISTHYLIPNSTKFIYANRVYSKKQRSF